MQVSIQSQLDWKVHKESKRKERFLDKEATVRTMRQLKLEHNEFREFDNNDREEWTNQLTDFMVE